MIHLKKLYIEPTSLCNFNCKMCFRSTWFHETPGSMSLHDYTRILNSLRNSVDTIFFGGMGEPFYHKDILEMIQLAKSKGLNVEILTNGSLLNEDVIRKLFQMRLNKLWISIDSLIETTETQLGHPNIHHILQNMTLVKKMRERNGSSLKLGITFPISILLILVAMTSFYMIES